MNKKQSGKEEVEMRFEGKVAVVTGGGTGIGRELCVAYAKEGAKVAVIYNSSRKGADETVTRITLAGGEAVAIQCDLSDVDSVRNMIREAYKAFGRIDILVNNGAARNQGYLLEQSLEDWNNLMDANLRGMFFAMQEAAPIMEKQGAGYIINVSSVMGYRPSLLTRIAYTSSKRGIMALTRSAADELGKKGIHVNCIVPGSFATGNPTDSKTAGVNEKVNERRKKAIALGRKANPDEMNGLTLFLSCPESEYIHGECIVCDGGWISGD